MMFSASSTASSVTEAPRRMFVPTWTWAKPCWPEPQLSIGRELEALDRSHRCWETIGPVLDLAQKTIFPALRALLEEQKDYLTEREPIKSPVTFGIYMSGRRKEEANPTLLFCCSRVQPRKRAKEVVKESQIIRDHPALRIAHSKRSPLARTSIRIFVGPLKGIQASDVPAFGEVYCIAPVDRTCGVPVFVRRKDGAFRKATIGGIVQFNEQYYGLTVAHTFLDNEAANPEESGEDLSDMECSFDSDDDLSALNERESAARAERLPRLQRRSSREFSSFRTATLSKALQHIDEDRASDSLVGSLFQYSIHTGLDWALIKIDNSLVNPKLCNSITLTNEYEERTLWPRALVTTGPAERAVLAITGDKGVIQGSMSRNSIYMRTAQTRGFQELWTIHMTSGLVEGDCGSWVVDRENGQLYGVIVAGHPGTGIGYVIPASQIFESVWQTLGDALILPSGASSETVVARSPHGQKYLPFANQDDGFRPLTRSHPSMNATAPITDMSHASYPRSNNRSPRDKDVLRIGRGLAQVAKKSLGNFDAPSSSSFGGLYEDDYGSKATADYWTSSITDVSGDLRRHTMKGIVHVDEERYKESSKVDASRNNSFGYASRELRRRDFDRARESETSTPKPHEDPNDQAIAQVLQRNEKDARRSERRDSSPIDPSRPIYTKISRRHVSLETLRVRQIDYEINQADPEYVLVKRRIPEDEQEALWEHTRRIRSSNAPSSSGDTQIRKSYQSSTTSQSSSDYDSDSEEEVTIKSFGKSHNPPSRHSNSKKLGGLESKVPVIDDNNKEPESGDITPPSTPPPRFPPALAAGTVASPQPLAYDPSTLQPGVQLPEGWTSHLDETSGNPYYVHIPTQTVQWELPMRGPGSPPGQDLLQPTYGDGAGYTGYGAYQPAASDLQIPKPTALGVNEEEPRKGRDSKHGPDPRSKARDSKKFGGSKPHTSKSSAKGSTNASETSSDLNLSKHRSKDSNASSLLMFLGGGKKR